MILKCLGFGDSKKEKTVIEELCHHFSFEALRKATNGFDKKLQIGGGFGKLYRGCLKHNNGDASDYTIALKVMPIWKFNEYYYYNEFKKEIEMLCELRHTNILSLIGFCDCYQKKRRIVVYEYMGNGSLEHYLSNMNKEPLSWNKRLEICIGVARGLHYLHAGAKRCIFHRDIKPDNILLDRNMVPKISGFELSLQGSKSKKIIVDCIAGTSGYIAPEQTRHGYVTDKSDVFSFGMVLLDLVAHSARFYYRYHKEDDPTLEERMDPILKGKIAPECWQVFTSLIQSCSKIEAEERPTMGEAEILLENALSLQQHADSTTNTNAAHYNLLSTTYLSDILFSVV